MALFDSHAHLDFVDNLEKALSRAKEAGVVKMISVGTTLEESKKAIEISNKLSTDDLAIYASVGLHPKDGRGEVEKLGLMHCFKTVKQLAESSDRVVAIGECGLDYYEISDKRKATSNKERKFQRELFEAQIKLAADLDLPLVIHCRDAWDEIFDTLSVNNYSSSQAKQSREVTTKNTNLKGKFSINSNNKLRGVFHSWTGNWDTAQKAFELGFYISFSGIVTFRNAQNIAEVAKKTPLDRILIETDSPFLSPEPFRGRTNEPKNVKIVARFLADLRGLPFAKIADVTTVNAEKLFRL